MDIGENGKEEERLKVICLHLLDPEREVGKKRGGLSGSTQRRKRGRGRGGEAKEEERNLDRKREVKWGFEPTKSRVPNSRQSVSRRRWIGAKGACN